MEDKINFNELWAGQKTGTPSPDDMILKIDQFKKSNLKRLILTNLLLLVTSVFIIIIWIYYQPQMLTTKLGILLIILAMGIYAIAYNQSFTLYKNKTNTLSNSEYLKVLLTIKAKQQFMHTTMLNLYFILLSSGLALYLYEYTSRMKTIWGLFAYGITAAWILLNWFYLRPKEIKKQQLKLDEIILKIEKINKQLDQ